MAPRGLFVILGWVFLALFVVQGTHGQERPDTPPDTTGPPPRADSLNQRPADQGGPPPGQEVAQSGPPSGQQRPGADGPGPGGGDENAVTFSAQDSLVIRTDSAAGNRGTLYGNAEVSYQEATLQARTIKMNFESSTLEATGPPADSVNGDGRPVFQQGQGGGGGQGSPGGGGGSEGGQSFTGDVLSYNMNTKRGRVVAARTQRRDGYVEGGTVKMYEDSTLFVQDGTYTTCDCPPGVTPSYSLRSDQMKLKDRWVYTGPIHLYLFNVPTPLWLPFGFLPNVQGRRSGPLPPQYGEDNKGFFLRDWGWYFALNSYTDLTIRGGIWSKGSYEINPRFRYEKRYEYSGDLQFTYQRVRIGEEEDPNPVRRHEGDLRWSHNQTLSPTASINGDIDLATSGDFARRNRDTFNDAVRQEVSSSVNYRKRWPNGGRSFNLSARQSQKLQSGRVQMTLPSLGFSQNAFKPFRQEQRIGDERWYEKITTSYQLDVDNRYNFNPRDPAQLREGGTEADSVLADSIEQADISWYEALVDRQKYRLATGDDELYDFEAQHEVPLRVSFRVDRYNLTLSPSINYNSSWYINTVRRVAIRDSVGAVDEVTERTEPGFYARHDFNTSFSSSTQIYGLFPVGIGSFQGLRHTMSPSLSMNYRPNYNTPFWGRTRRVRFEDGTPVPDSLVQAPRYDILDGSFVRRSTQQWSLNFSLGNDFETKRVQTDTTGQQRTEKVQLLNLDLSGLSYNFAADSFRVGNNISLNARTRVDPFNVSMRSSFSPYALRPTTIGNESVYRRIDRLMVAESPLTPVRLTDFNLSLSANVSSDDSGTSGQRTRSRGSRRRSSDRQRRGPQRQNTPGASQQSSPEDRSTGLSELRIPWSLNLNFNYGLSKPRKEITNRKATLGVSFDLNITELWRLSGNTGYDFMQKELSTTRIRINRNLGCWTMSFHWVPFGQYQKYGFNLQVTSGQLSQLLRLQVPNKGGQGRLGGFGDQLRGAAQGAAGVGRGGGSTGSRRF